MNDDAFFRDLMRWHWPTAGGLLVPVFFPSLSAIVALHTASSTQAALLLPDRRMSLISVAPGRCLVGVLAVEYRESDLGPYSELAIVVPMAFDAPAGPWVSMIRDSLARSFSAYVWRMPVSTPLSRDAGVSLAGFPKELADIRFRQAGGVASCELTQDGVPAVSLSCASAASTGRRNLRVRAYTQMQGLSLVSRLHVQETRFDDRLRPTAAQLELGQGALADELRALRLSENPIASHYCAEAKAILFAPRNAIEG